MTKNHLHHRTAAVALSIAALASCGLTACGSSSDPTPTAQRQTSLTPQQAAIRQEGITELVNCARRHGIHLPPPTAAGVNVSGVKGHRNEVAMSICYHHTVKVAEARERANKAK